MKTRTWLTTTALCAAAALAAPIVSSGEAKTAPTDETELGSAMETMEDALRSLRKSLRSAEQNPASLATLVELQAAVHAAKVETPAMAGKMPAEQRPAFVRDYRKEMVGMARMLLDLELLVLEGKQEEAGDLLKKIRRLEDSGHERFTEDG